MKGRRTTAGFTIVELITVVAILSLLIGLLLPAVTAVKNMAKEAQQKAQFVSIESALTAFRNDYGDYPPSNYVGPGTSGFATGYCGPQKLAEALLGWDLMGFHPKSKFRVDGCYPDPNGTLPSLYTAATVGERRGRYLELDKSGAFRLGWSSASLRDGVYDLTPAGRNSTLDPDRAVLTDSFTNKSASEYNTITGEIRRVKVGSPILYSRANVSGRDISEIYKFDDVAPFLALGSVNGPEVPESVMQSSYPNQVHPLWVPGGSAYRAYLTDPKVTTMQWPVRPDSYILISAGKDGLYGTDDDITNFER